MLISSRKISIPCVADAIIPKFWPGIKKIIIFTPKMRFLGKNWMAGLTRLKFLSQINQNICTKMTKRASLSVKPFMVKWLFEITKYLKRVTWAIQNIWVKLFYLTFNLSPNRSQNTIESYYGYDCSWLKWSNIQRKWKWSNIFFKYLTSEIMIVLVITSSSTLSSSLVYIKGQRGLNAVVHKSIGKNYQPKF